MKLLLLLPDLLQKIVHLESKTNVLFQIITASICFAVFLHLFYNFVIVTLRMDAAPFTLLPMSPLVKPYYKIKESPFKLFNSAGYFIG